MIRHLESADRASWTDGFAASDGLPARPSGPWIGTKHALLTHYAHMFATGMKNKWPHRVYLELFSGPGRCVVRGTNAEDLGSPLKVIDHEFTKFIFTEKSVPAAEALSQRLAAAPNGDKAEIWCGDCAEAIHHMSIPNGALTFAFIDPTGIGHAPFSLIETLRTKTRCDVLVNIQHAMGIKMNIHQYTPDADDESALTRFLGHDRWKRLPRHNAKDFFNGVLDQYKQQLARLDFKFIGRQVMVSTTQGQSLYLLLFASGHPKGQEFWEKSWKRVLAPEFDLGV